MTFTPHITVASVIKNNGRFLFVREHTRRGIAINQPAGHLEANETLEQAAIRETLEETGWHIKLSAIIGIYIYKAANDVTYQRLCFAGTPLYQEPDTTLDTGIIEPLWLTPQELQQLQSQWRSPLVMQCLQDALSGEHYPLSMLKGIF